MTTMTAPSLAHRVIRSSTITVLGFGASQVIRLASNLILTRLLFPEAFGMMALVTVFLVGVVMLSDIGIGTAIMQSRRGDDPAFLDTAWTIQIVRGMLLWLVTLVVSPLVASFYGEPDLQAYLPVSALVLVIGAFKPTRLETANRHLRAGLVTLLDLAAQVIGIATAVVLAWLLESIWALVLSNLLTTVAQLVLLHTLLPGYRNRLGWEREAASELIHFGKWIFLATLCGFAIAQADKVILGRHLDLDHFGLYNIAFFLASVPVTLGSTVTTRVLIPLYRDAPPSASAANAARIRKLRMGALLILLLLSATLAFTGAWLVQLMYDSRYHEAGAIVVLIAVTQAPALLILTYDQAALAMGDSLRYFVWTLARAVLATSGLAIGLWAGGLAGAVIGQGLGTLAAYPVLAWLVRPYQAWDPRLDAVFLGAATLLGALALWANLGSLAIVL
jgi:O-antigen/teichoic acid export membrane protein